VRFGYYADGVVLAWRRERLKLVRINRSTSSRSGRASIVATLEALKDGRRIVIACTHLNSKTGQKREDLRYFQTSKLLEDIDEARTLARGTEGQLEAVILAGDFNTDPHDVTHPKAHAAKAIPSVRAYGLASAYPLALDESAFNGEDVAIWTTWKVRGDYEAKHQIDYIWYEGFKCTSVLLPPAKLGPGRLPSLSYPSDHIAIAADLQLNPCSDTHCDGVDMVKGQSI